DLAEGADMRQARRTVAGLEQHLVLRAFLQPRDNGLGLLERPGVGLFGERTQIARAKGKVDDGHLLGLSPEAAETSASGAKCKISGGNRRVGKAKRAHHHVPSKKWWARRQRAFAHPTKHSPK